jgi:hypothetical protein
MRIKDGVEDKFFDSDRDTFLSSISSDDSTFPEKFPCESNDCRLPVFSLLVERSFLHSSLGSPPSTLSSNRPRHLGTEPYPLGENVVESEISPLELDSRPEDTLPTQSSLSLQDRDEWNPKASKHHTVSNLNLPRSLADTENSNDEHH